MKSSDQEIIIEHGAKNLYKIVLEIEEYPKFIPWCNSVNIQYKKIDEILVDMIVFYKYFSPQTFTSHVKFNSKNKTGKQTKTVTLTANTTPPTTKLRVIGIPTLPRDKKKNPKHIKG